jgi:hypothetical protein
MNKEWSQPGFVVISWAGVLPLVHKFCYARWEAELEEKRILEELPEDLRSGLKIVESRLIFTA